MSQLVLTTDTLAGTPVTGTLEYNGQFYGTDSNASRAQMQRLVLGTALSYTQATNANTTLDFTGIPAWAKKITVMFAGVSTSGTSNLLIRLTGSGAVETSGYVSDAATASASSGTAASTAGFLLCNSIAATDILSGNFTLCLQNASSNTWAHSGLINRSGGTGVIISAGYKSITGALTAVRITTVNGTDTFDAGSVNILYEG